MKMPIRSVTLPISPACLLLAALLSGGCRDASGKVGLLAPDKELGVNLENIADWNRGWMFADAMKHARKWGAPNSPWDESAPVDANGWPTGDAGVVVMTGGVPADLAGTYKLSFTGKAEVVPVASSFTVTNQVYNADMNTTTADVVVDDKLNQIMMSFRGQPGGVKNVKLMRPGHTDETFTRQFLARLKPFTVIRFMDYLQTNTTQVKNWSDRLPPTYATQQSESKGSSWEYAIGLCNQAGKDAWINIPDQASDDYVANVARLFRDTLKPHLGIYVEWSNEVWNDGFVQSGRNYAATQAELAAGGSVLNRDGETNVYVLGWRRIAKRGKEVRDIFRSVFGDAAMMTRVRPVLASQVGRIEVLRQGLEFIERQYGPPSKYFYAASGTTYFNIDNDIRTNLTVDQIFAELPAQLEVEKDMQVVFTAWARYYKLKNIAYEGGPHLFGDASVEAKIAANRDPRMKDILLRNYDNWYSVGGDLNVYFNLAGIYTKFGSWGLTDRLNEDTPKTAAIDAVQARPKAPLTAGTAVPATLKTSDAMTNNGGYFITAEDYFGMNGPEVWINFLIRAPADGSYRLRARVRRTGAGAKLAALLNSDPVTSWNVDSDTWQDLPAAPLKLEAGLNVLRLAVAAGTLDLTSVTIENAPDAG